MKVKHLAFIFLSLYCTPIYAQSESIKWTLPVILVLIVPILILLAFILLIVLKILFTLTKESFPEQNIENYLRALEPGELSALIEARKIKNKTQKSSLPRKASGLTTIILMAPVLSLGADATTTSLSAQPGVIITVGLVLIPLAIIALLLVIKAKALIELYQKKVKEKEAAKLAEDLMTLSDDEIDASLLRRKSSLEYKLSNSELCGTAMPDDTRGLLQNVANNSRIHFVPTKKKAVKRPNVDPQLAKLIIWYVGTATFWLLFGTTVGEYLGIKFVSPDADHVSWLSFGRLRPVHTNAVFWGWSSLAMIGLAHYVVSIVSNTSIASLKKGWISLGLINASVMLGTICLMAGINNGGGEYREYVWPVMALFGAGLAITLVNFIQTVANRKTREIYISNWYIVSAIIFTIIIAFIAYWPTWQNGLGETIVQGYYMHQGVGMWFMLFTLGIVYYFLPQQLNRPIYSYSLGILAFWTQILFYTVIGTHHFVFSAIPWWLQTVAIVGSLGMLIPVLAGTTNFLMTFKGEWNRMANSYTLPFFLVGIVFYFTGSFQGTAEAFRYTNLLWHFTDFTVAHSHITMYGIIAFLLWGSIYALIPRLTGKEPSQLLVGAHFWMAFIGLMFYSIPLMIGGTLKGLLWMDGKPFMESVTLMAPYWLWRAIGGSMMWISHLFFAFNFYKMISKNHEVDVKSMAFEKIKHVSTKENEAVLIN